MTRPLIVFLLTKQIERRGPARHQNGFACELFRHCRFAIVCNLYIVLSAFFSQPVKSAKPSLQIISALVRRRHCYLTKPEWKVLARSPDGITSQAVAREEDLTNLFAEVPGLLYDFGQMQASNASPNSALNLQIRLCRILSDLYIWRLRRATSFVLHDSRGGGGKFSKIPVDLADNNRS